jgi:long-chain fatty acid transport protein
VSTKVDLPETVTLGMRHKLNDRWNVMGGFEWTNWSRLQEAVIQYSATSIVEEFHWEDGYFASLGAEYAYSDKTTLRAGVGYEWSPVNDDNRGVRIPDADRLWLSAGFSHTLSEKFTMHAGYSLVLAEKGNISLANPALGSSFTGESSGLVHIVSFGVKAKF